MCGLIRLAILALVALHQVSCYFEVEMTEGRAILGEGNKMNFEKVKIKKVNKTSYAINGAMDVNIDLDDTYEVKLNLYKKQGNEYRLTPFHVGPHKFCDYIQNKALAYDHFLECSDMPARKDCPWKKKTYNFNKCLAPIDKVPRFFDGEFRADVTVSRNDKIAGGYQVFFYVISLGG